jgi:hypothetical protein
MSVIMVLRAEQRVARISSSVRPSVCVCVCVCLSLSLSAYDPYLADF